jgi:hypothetical protein
MGAPTTRPSPTPIVQVLPGPTATPTASPTPVPNFPPKPKADLHALAAKGDASAIHEFNSHSVGLTGVAPQPRREVTVSPSLTGQQLAEDVLAYFYQNGLDSPCGPVVFAYHATSEAANASTAGRILVQTENIDPNNSNAQRTLALDLGDAINGEQEHVITC